MDITNFVKMQKDGTSKLQHLGGEWFAFATRNWDPQNGKEQPPRLEKMSREQVVEMIKFVEENLDSCKTILAQMDELAKE